MLGSARQAVGTAWNDRTASRVVSWWASGDGFLAVLLLASVAPFVAPLLAMPLGRSAAAGFAFAAAAGVVAVSNAHVFATFYVLCDRAQLRGVERPVLNLIAVPAAICAAIIGITVTYPALATAVIAVVVGFYGSYHFGRQNLGVHTFACRIANGRAMDPVERRAIVAGVACALVRGAAVGIPALMRLAGLSSAPLARACAVLDVLGWAGWAVLSVVVVWHVLRNRAQYDWRSVATLLIAVYFFLPGALSPFFFGALVIAHGLQYMVFLAYHGVGAARLNLADSGPDGLRTGMTRTAAFAVVAPFVTLAAWTLLGYAVFYVTSTPAASLPTEAFLADHKNAITWLGAAVTGVTVSHYWVDQHLWRFRSPERRAWFTRYYAFLTPERAPGGVLR